MSELGPVPPLEDSEETRPRGSHVDLSRWVAGEDVTPPPPQIGRRTDGAALFYAGRTHCIYGDSETGKTWAALAVGIEAIEDGATMAYLDVDRNGWPQLVTRIAQITDLDRATIAERLRIYEPDDAEAITQAVKEIKEWAPRVVVLDSMGELLAAAGMSSNNPEDFTAVHSQWCAPPAKAGACVIVIDHDNKAGSDNGPTGTAAKKRSTDIVYRVIVKDGEVFTPGRGGACTFFIVKDRIGGVRAISSPGRNPCAATFRMSSDGRCAFTPPTGAEAAAAGDGELVARLAALDPAPRNANEARERLGVARGRGLAAYKQWKDLGCPSVSELASELTPAPVGPGPAPSIGDHGTNPIFPQDTAIQVVPDTGDQRGPTTSNQQEALTPAGLPSCPHGTPLGTTCDQCQQTGGGEREATGVLPVLP